MALITCVKCSGKVSDRAAKCPHCGCPVAIAVQSMPADSEVPSLTPTQPRPAEHASPRTQSATPPARPRLQASPAAQSAARVSSTRPVASPTPKSRSAASQHRLNRLRFRFLGRRDFLGFIMPRFVWVVAFCSLCRGWIFCADAVCLRLWLFAAMGFWISM